MKKLLERTNWKKLKNLLMLSLFTNMDLNLIIKKTLKYSQILWKLFLFLAKT